MFCIAFIDGAGDSVLFGSPFRASPSVDGRTQHSENEDLALRWSRTDLQ